MDKRVKTEMIADALKVSKKKASRFKFASSLPYLHRPHSAGPFICDRDLGLVGKIVFSSETFSDVVDFSFPGRPDISIHTRYEDIIEILRSKYPSLIEEWKSA